MTLYIVIAITIAAIVGFFLLKRARHEKDIIAGLSAIGLPKELAQFKHKYKTQGGVEIWSTVEVPTQIFSVIDAGITRTRNRYKTVFPYWTEALTLPDYKVLFIDPNAEREAGGPALYVSGGIKTAGTCIGLGVFPVTKKSQWIVAPHQAAYSWAYAKPRAEEGGVNYLEDTIANEAEHYIESANDIGLFERFAITGDVHPHEIP